MKRIVYGLVVAVLFCACAKLEEKFGRLNTETSKITLNMSRSGLNTSGVLNGSVFIYITGEPGTPFRKSVQFPSEDAANGAIIEMPLGTYKMSAIGITAGGLTGDVYCAKAENGGVITLDKSTKNVDLRLWHANCNDPYFTTSANQYTATQGFRTMQFVSCQAGTNMSGFTTSSACGSSKGDIGHTRSVRVQLLSYFTDGGNPDASRIIGGAGNCARGEGKPLSNPCTGTGAATGGQAFFALDNNIMFFGEASGGVFRSTDGGANFSQPGTLNTGNVAEISGTGSYVYAATTSGVFQSTDSGATWSNANLSTGSFYSVYAVGSKVIAGKSISAALSISADSGATYTAQSASSVLSGAVESVFYVPATDTYYASGTFGGNAVVVKSTDSGATWSNFKTITSGGSAWVFKIIGGKYYIGTSLLGLHVSSDGTTWTQYCNSGCAAGNGTLPDNNVNDIVINNGTWYVATAVGIGVGVNNGSIWENYGTTELGATAGTVKKMGFANGKLFFNHYGAASSMRSTNSRGNGALFPTTGVANHPRLPYGGSSRSPFAANVEVFGNGSCAGVPDRQFMYPLGIGNESSVSNPPGESAFRDGGGNTVLFLRDF